MRRTALAAALALVAFAAPPLLAQQSAAAPPSPPPVTDSADVKTMDGILRALYGVISGDSTQERNWNRFKSLFLPGARLIPTGPRQAGGVGARVWTPDEYAERAAPMFRRQGFFEIESARRTETYGPIVHVFSTYESRRAASDGQPFQRGINSIQLMNDGTRWWIVTIYWWGETPGTPIPARYLNTENH